MGKNKTKPTSEAKSDVDLQVMWQNNASKVSDFLKQRIINSFNEVKPLIDKRLAELKPTLKGRYITFPFMTDGIFDMVRYDLKENRYDQISFEVAMKGIEPAFWEHTAYCDETMRVVLSI